MEVMLPEVFAGLRGKVNFVVRITDNEYHSSCPRCGGEEHQDGSYPNRFVMWVVSRYGTPFAMCRKCSYKWSPDKEDAHWTHKERLAFAIKAKEMEIAYLRRKSEELAALSAKIHEQNLFEEYHQTAIANEKVMEHYRNMGIPEDWVKYLKLGFMFDYKVTGRNSTYRDTAFTFPVWSLNRIENIKVRVQHPINKEDRYRNIYKSGCQHLYTPIHDNDKLLNKVVVMEGEKKAMVGHISGELPEDVQVVGLQSMTPEKRIISMLKNSDVEVFYLALDPEAYVPAGNGVAPVMNIVKEIGEKRCRLMVPPADTKFDDAILLGYKFRNAFNMAIKPEKL